MNDALHRTPDPQLCCGLPTSLPRARARTAAPLWQRLIHDALSPAMRLHRYRHLSLRAVEDVIDRPGDC